MKRLHFCVSVLAIFFQPFIGKAQETEIRFESGLSWTEILAKATVEGKPIFMDCYTTWCGPCQFMERHIYRDSVVAGYFNAHFINVKVQMDKSVKDSVNVRDWYTTADSIARRYTINGYPSFLVFSAEGRPLHKWVGASETGTEFIAKAAIALQPEYQYYVLLSNWEDHKSDSAYLYQTIIAARNAGDEVNADSIASQYVQGLNNLISKRAIDLLSSSITSTRDPIFQFYLHHGDQINKSEDKIGYTEEKLTAVIFHEQIAPLFGNKNMVISIPEICAELRSKYPNLNQGLFMAKLKMYFEGAIGKKINLLVAGRNLQPKDWTGISDRLKAQFPGYDFGKGLLYAEVKYYFYKRSWDVCSEDAITLADRYGNEFSAKALNDLLWKCVFLHSQNRKILDRAISHMKHVVKTAPEDTDDLDTYANLLYKTGHDREAIEWENRAINVAQKNHENSATLEDTLHKMQEGEITWEIDKVL